MKWATNILGSVSFEINLNTRNHPHSENIYWPVLRAIIGLPHRK